MFKSFVFQFWERFRSSVSEFVRLIFVSILNHTDIEREKKEQQEQQQKEQEKK